MPTDRQRYRTGRARELRREQTNAEIVFWRTVRSRGFRRLKFKRQRPFGRYFLDFFCEDLNLVVELDGGPHLDPTVAAHDAERTAFLQSRGLTVVRFENDELLESPHLVFARLDRIVDALIASTEESRPMDR